MLNVIIYITYEHQIAASAGVVCRLGGTCNLLRSFNDGTSQRRSDIFH